jgi:hypothetical protein
VCIETVVVVPIRRVYLRPLTSHTPTASLPYCQSQGGSAATCLLSEEGVVFTVVLAVGDGPDCEW